MICIDSNRSFYELNNLFTIAFFFIDIIVTIIPRPIEHTHSYSYKTRFAETHYLFRYIAASHRHS